MPQTAIRVFCEADGTAPLTVWLDELELREPRAHVKCLQKILLLSQLGFELRRPQADLLRDGVYELRTKVGTVNYRILYSFCGSNIACLSHGITKGGRVPNAEIDLAVKRKKLVEDHPETYTAEWEV